MPNPSATELAELCFEEIEEQNPAINAYLAVSRERALRAAEAIDQLRCAGAGAASAGRCSRRN